MKTKAINERKNIQYCEIHSWIFSHPRYLFPGHTYGALISSVAATPLRKYSFYVLTQSFCTGTKVIRRKHIIQPTGSDAYSSTCCQWDGEDVPAPRERWNSHPPVRVQKSCVNQFIWYNICSRGVFVISHSKLRNCVIIAIEYFLQQLNVFKKVSTHPKYSLNSPAFLLDDWQ